MVKKMNKNSFRGYKIIEDNSIKELRLPKEIIDWMKNFVWWGR